MDIDLQACIRGEKHAWDAFVARWSRLIYAAVTRTMSRGSGGDRAGHRELVEDAVQEVFVRLVKDEAALLRRYDPSRASLSTWLTLVARSVAIDQMRRTRRAPAALTSDVAETADQEASSAAAAVAPAIPLHLLTDRQRLVLRLLFDEGRPVPEAARIVGVDPQTIRSTKHKALTRLREHLMPEQGPSA